MQINTGEHCFYIGDNIKTSLAYISYTELENNIWQIDHTVVKPELQGQGIAKLLTIFMLQSAHKKGMKIIPICTYTQSFFKKYPEYQALLK